MPGTLVGNNINLSAINYGMDQSQYVNNKTLTATTSGSDTVPNGASKVLISTSCPVFIDFGTSISIPGSVTDGSGYELINGSVIRNITGATISFVAPTSGYISFAYYA